MIFKPCVCDSEVICLAPSPEKKQHLVTVKASTRLVVLSLTVLLKKLVVLSLTVLLKKLVVLSLTVLLKKLVVLSLTVLLKKLRTSDLNSHICP